MKGLMETSRLLPRFKRDCAAAGSAVKRKLPKTTPGGRDSPAVPGNGTVSLIIRGRKKILEDFQLP
jgi:hypothetical protein